MTARDLLVMALEMECHEHFRDIPILFTGVGKLNAAYTLTKAIGETRPRRVINLGTAGSRHFNAGDLVNCTSFIQRDMDATPLGFELFETPFDATPAVLANGERIALFPEGACGSGDSFDISDNDAPYSLVDMEAFALAKVCRAEELPFICIKYITDGANGQAAADWKEALEKAALGLREVYERLATA